MKIIEQWNKTIKIADLFWCTDNIDFMIYTFRNVRLMINNYKRFLWLYKYWANSYCYFYLHLIFANKNILGIKMLVWISDFRKTWILNHYSQQDFYLTRFSLTFVQTLWGHAFIYAMLKNSLCKWNWLSFRDSQWTLLNIDR